VGQYSVPVPAATVVYTDGACSGNPGPGGWAWAVPRGRYASGARARTTNQRMEIMAVLEAAKALDGPLEVVSDSTYVINCFRDRLVGRLAPEELDQQSETAGRQSRSVGAAHRDRAATWHHVPLGEGPLGGPDERAGRSARWGGSTDPAGPTGRHSGVEIQEAEAK
jgi:ribonuclease HI